MKDIVGNGFSANVVHDTIRQTYYKLSFDIYKDVFGRNISDSIKYAKKHISKDKYKIVGNDFVDDCTSLICVSDAHTHVERLVFPAFKVESLLTGSVFYDFDPLQIAGEMTMMFMGGDRSTVLEPVEYIQQLYEVNKQYN